MLLLLEGQTVYLPALKGHYAKDIVFETDTPIFCTGKHELVLIKGGCIDERETKMMRVRWKIFNFSFADSTLRAKKRSTMSKMYSQN